MNNHCNPVVGYTHSQLNWLDRFVVVSCLILVPSAVIQSIVGLDEKLMFAFVAPVIVVVSLLASPNLVHRSMPALVLLLILIGTVGSLVSQYSSQFLMGLTLALAVIVGRQLFITLCNPKALRAISWFSLVILVGGVVGMAYAAAGGSPLMDVQVGYRTTYLYLSTFSFAFIGDTLRPSGIFDEPGALAMYVGIITMFNDVLRQNARLTLAMMVLLVCTGSLAGLALSLWYLVSSNAMRTRRARNLGLVLALLGGYGALSFLYPSNFLSSSLEAFYAERLQIDQGKLVGDNRSGQVVEFLELVDQEMLLRGTRNSPQAFESDDQSSNPFSITYGYGAIISIPYFAILFFLAFTTLRRGSCSRYAAGGLLFLLLQRPYVYNLSWSILIAAVAWLLHQASLYYRLHVDQSR